MRILIISDAWNPQVNGVVRTYQGLLPHLHARGHVVQVIGPDRFLSVPMPFYNEIRLALWPWGALPNMIAQFAPDRVHIAVEGPLGLVTRHYCIEHNIPFSTCYHTQFPAYVAKRVAWMGERLTRFIEARMVDFVRWFHAPAKTVFVATQSLEDQLKAWGFAAPLVRWVRGVDATVFHAGPPTLFQNMPRPIMLYVGRVAVEKNIEAFLNMPVAGTKIIVGRGPDLSGLQAKYPQAVFKGLQEGAALADHYRSADVFVFPSKTDTFGMVLTEALACGLAIAGYDVMGPRDIINMPLLGAVDNDLSVATQKALAAEGTAAARSFHAHTLYSWDSVTDVFVAHV